MVGVTCAVYPGFSDVLIEIKSNNPEFESDRFTFDPNIAARDGWVDICIEAFLVRRISEWQIKTDRGKKKFPCVWSFHSSQTGLLIVTVQHS